MGLKLCMFAYVLIKDLCCRALLLHSLLNRDPRVESWPARLLSAGSYHSAPLLAPCVFSALEQIKFCMLPCQQILQTLMCRWTHKHTLVHTSSMHSGILIFRCANAHVYHVEDLHFCTISRQIHTLFPKRLITHKSCHNASLPTHYAFKSSPLPFIDSNLRIVLEFWHLLILNLLTPGGPELNINPGIYRSTYKENIPKTPWIVAIHAHKRDSKWSVRAQWLIEISAATKLCILRNHLIGDVVSTSSSGSEAGVRGC